MLLEQMDFHRSTVLSKHPKVPSTFYLKGMNTLGYVLLFIIGVPLVCLAVQSMIYRLKPPIIIAATKEGTDGLVVAKHFSPEKTVGRMAFPGEYAVFYEDFTYVGPQYWVDVMSGDEIISLDNQDLFESVKIGDFIHLELEHQKLVQKGLLSDENSYRTQVRDFSLNP